MKLLMHICCANCAINPVFMMLGEGHEVTGLWFNPNIHPEDEYNKRLGAVRQLAEATDIRMDYRGEYGLDMFNSALKEAGATERPARCAVCYRIRMQETARLCAEGKFDAFTTSLLISPYQEHGLIVEEARKAADMFGTKFHYIDFRPGWREGQNMAREKGFYRQYYCGCAYSKAERDNERSEKAAGKRERSI